MRRRLVSVLLVVGSTTVAADVPPDRKAKLDRLAAERKDVTGKLRAALAGGDKDAVAGVLGVEVKLRGLWFPSEACLKTFGGRATVKQEDLAVFAGCLIALEPKPYNDNDLIYEPGVVVW